jgi:tetratricopeptide (TPR) repeat protein
MERQRTQTDFERITRCLEQKKLQQAFHLTALLFARLQNWQLQEKLLSLEDTYKMMLHYQINGVQDPKREKVYTDIIRSLYQIVDAVEVQIKTSNDNSLFYERKRAHHFYVSKPSDKLFAQLDHYSKISTLADLMGREGENEEEENRRWKDLNKQTNALIRKIFYTAWLSDLWTTEEKDRWASMINNRFYPVSIPSLIVTALTLNLLETFDEKKAILLFEAAQNENEETLERAITGIVLFLRKYNNRLHLYPGLTERLYFLSENPQFIHRIRHVLLQFILCRDTEKITKKIKDELLPEMIKMGPKISAKFKLDDLFSETGLTDKNPEWQKMIEEAGLQDKLQELSDMQLEGADIMHSSFIHLKNYPFFSEPCNWFIPFSSPGDAIGNNELTQLATVLETSTLLCNSDKYSFFLSVSQMPENYRKMMISQFSAETDAMKDILKSDLKNPSKTIDYRTRQYIQDLYRFYKLHPRKNDFEDIFETKPEFYKIPHINSLMKDQNNESLFIIAEYYFNRNYFEEAADLYSAFLEHSPSNDMLYQKKGYCLQMLGDWEGALDAYQKANLLAANNPWTVKKLAYCYRILKSPEESLHYYKKAEQLNPDNFSIQLNIGHCYMELKDYDQAMKYYFKVEYLTKNKEKAWRPIAWCAFLTGKYPQAEDYLNKLMENNPNPVDYLNAGHVQLALGKIREALHYYQLSWEKGNQTQKDFMDTFVNDIPDLIQAGIKENDMPFILDILEYNYSTNPSSLNNS